MADLNYLYLASLVTKAQQNDGDAFADLYGLTYKRQYNYACHYLKDIHLAQDAVQEVYIHALKHITDIKDPTLFIAWLNQINFHICFDICKKRDKNYGEINPLALELTFDSNIEHSPEDYTQLNDEKRRLRLAVNALPPSEQQVIAMRYFNNMKLEEIALTMGISRSTVKRQLVCGRDKLEKMLR